MARYEEGRDEGRFDEPFRGEGYGGENRRLTGEGRFEGREAYGGDPDRGSYAGRGWEGARGQQGYPGGGGYERGRPLGESYGPGGRFGGRFEEEGRERSGEPGGIGSWLSPEHYTPGRGWGGGGRWGGAFGGGTEERGRFAEGRLVGPYVGRGPKGYRRSDERIREDVCDRLEQHPFVDASEIEVGVRDGVVTLSGTVGERAAKRMAEDVAEGVSGVKDVNNQVRVARREQPEPAARTAAPSRPSRTR